MAILGRAALAVWLECVPEAEADFDRWYREQHLAERLAVPGFLRGRRYEAVRGAPKYFAFYETESGEVLRSPTYMERLNNPTDWTRRVMPAVRNFTRGVYRLLHTEGGPGPATSRGRSRPCGWIMWPGARRRCGPGIATRR
jgi:hypothetical protein